MELSVPLIKQNVFYQNTCLVLIIVCFHSEESIFLRVLLYFTYVEYCTNDNGKSKPSNKLFIAVCHIVKIIKHTLSYQGIKDFNGGYSCF